MTRLGATVDRSIEEQIDASEWGYTETRPGGIYDSLGDVFEWVRQDGYAPSVRASSHSDEQGIYGIVDCKCVHCKVHEAREFLIWPDGRCQFMDIVFYDDACPECD